MAGIQRKAYLLRVLSRAWTMTLEDAGFTSVKGTIFKLISSAISVYVVYTATGADEAVKELDGLAKGLLVFLMWLGAVLLINLLLAPASLQRDADKAINQQLEMIDRLTGELSKDGKRDMQFRSLSELWRSGKKLVGVNSFGSVNEFNAWEKEMTDWKSQMISLANDIKPEFGFLLDTLKPSEKTFSMVKFNGAPEDVAIWKAHQTHIGKTYSKLVGRAALVLEEMRARLEDESKK